MVLRAVLLALAVAAVRPEQSAEPERDGGVEAQLVGVEDPATREILRHVFARMAEMEEEIRQLRAENDEIRVSLEETEAKSVGLSERMDSLDKQQSTGVPTVQSFVSRLSLFGIKNSQEIGPRLYTQGIHSVPQLLGLDSSERGDLAQNFADGQLQVRMDMKASLRTQLSGFGMTEPVPMEAALQSHQVLSIADLAALDDAEREHLCDELKKVEYSAGYTTDVPGELRHSPRKPLPLGDRALVRRLALGLRESAKILGLSAQLSKRPRQSKESQGMSVNAPWGDGAEEEGKVLTPNSTATEIVGHAAGRWLGRSLRVPMRLWLKLKRQSKNFSAIMNPLVLLASIHHEPFTTPYIISVKWLQTRLVDVLQGRNKADV